MVIAAVAAVAGLLLLAAHAAWGDRPGKEGEKEDKC